jgi:hypothetical protein
MRGGDDTVSPVRQRARRCLHVFIGGGRNFMPIESSQIGRGFDDGVGRG